MESIKPNAKQKRPKHVAIVAMGGSNADYTLAASSHGGRQQLYDEVWGINVIGSVYVCDRVFMMDSFKCLDSIKGTAVFSDTAHSGYKKWLKECTVPVYSSDLDPDYPCIVEYPLEDVINTVGAAYFTNTIPYAIAFALHLGVEEISLFGCDYNYTDPAAAYEEGRSCLEFWLGYATAKGVKISVAEHSTLLETCREPMRRLYGFHYPLDIVPGDDGKVKVVRHKEQADAAD